MQFTPNRVKTDSFEFVIFMYILFYQIRFCGNCVFMALVGRARRVEPKQLKDASKRRSATTVTRWMGNERRSGPSLFNPYRSDDFGP